MLSKEENLLNEKAVISQALEYGLMAWRTTNSRAVFWDANAALNRLIWQLENSYDKTPVDCLISDLRSHLELNDGFISQSDFENRIKEWKEEVNGNDTSLFGRSCRDDLIQLVCALTEERDIAKEQHANTLNRLLRERAKCEGMRANLR